MLNIKECNLTRGKHLLLPHLLLLEEVLEEGLVTGAHFRLEACLKGHGAQQVPRQAMLDFCRSVLQPHGSLREETKMIKKLLFFNSQYTCCALRLVVTQNKL